MSIDSKKAANEALIKGPTERKFTNNNGALPSTDERTAGLKTINAVKKETSKIVENIFSGMVIDKIITVAPKDSDNQLAKSAGESGYFIEYLVTKSPITFDNVNLASPQDMYRYFACRQVRTAENLKGTDIAIGSIVNLTRKSPDGDDYFISEIVHQGTLIPGVDSTSTFDNPANAFKDPRCNPQEVRPNSDKLNSPQQPVDNNAAPTPNMPQNVNDCANNNKFNTTPPNGTILEWGKTGDKSLDDVILGKVAKAAEQIIPEAKNNPQYIRALMSIVNNEYDRRKPLDNQVGDAALSYGPSIGPMQVYRKTAIDFKLVPPSTTSEQYLLNRTNVDQVIEWGVKVYKEKLKVARGDAILAIKLYNGSGPQAENYQSKALSFVRSTYGNFA